MFYGCTQCYWYGNKPEECHLLWWKPGDEEELCCPDCGFPVLTLDEIQFKMAKLISLYTNLLRQEE